MAGSICFSHFIPFPIESFDVFFCSRRSDVRPAGSGRILQHVICEATSFDPPAKPPVKLRSSVVWIRKANCPSV